LKPLGEKAKGNCRKILMDYLLDDMKITRMTNWMKKTRKREVWYKFVEKAKAHQTVVEPLKERDYSFTIINVIDNTLKIQEANVIFCTSSESYLQHLRMFTWRM
jgi:hypothetical protein